MKIRDIRFLSIAALAAGCTSVDSGSVGTDGIYADLVATSDGGSTHTTATLRVGGATSNTFVNLEGDDALTVSADGTTQTMLESHLGDLYIYSSDFALSAEDTEFQFSLERSIDAGAPDSRCTLPAPFEITAPLDSDTFSRELDPITVSWTPSGTQDTIRISVSGDCLFDDVEDVSGDPGTFEISPGTIASIDESNPTSCDARITVQRRRVGTLDPGFGQGGSIYGVQDRELLLRSDP